MLLFLLESRSLDLFVVSEVSKGDKALTSLVVRAAEAVQVFSCGPITLSHSQPELPLVIAGEHRVVLLRLVLYDGVELIIHVLWRKRNYHVCHRDRPLLPGTSVHEYSVSFWKHALIVRVLLALLVVLGL